jgi:uncharacterized sulfatase
MKTYISLLFGLFTVFAVAANEKPNVIIIFTDDHGYSDLGCQGIFDDLKTPNIDRLARDGVRMTSGYASAPQCVPSRGGLMSGRYQNKLGLESNIEFQQPGGMDGFNSALTIAERLKKAGYATCQSGKWHLGPESEITYHGFDHFFSKDINNPRLANIDI